MGITAVLWYLIAPYAFPPVDRRDHEILRLTAALQAARAEVEASAKKISSLEGAHATALKESQATSTKAVKSIRQERDQAKALLEKRDQEIAQQIAAGQTARAENETSKKKFAASEATLAQSRIRQEGMGGEPKGA